MPIDATQCSTPCTHCGLPARCVRENMDSDVFCCQGCRGAYELIHGWGLENFYEIRDQSQSVEMAVGTGDTGFDAFENDEFLGRSRPREHSEGLRVTEMAIGGLHCAACVWLIENVAARTPGWHLARVKMNDHTIQLIFDPHRIRLSQIAELLDRLGYNIAPLSDDQDDHYRLENRKILVRIAIAGFCAANAMWIGIALYAGAEASVFGQYRDFLRLIGTGLGLVAVVVPGSTFFRGAIASLRTRTPHMDLPVALGLSVGTITGIVSALRGTGDVYFDSLAVLVFLLLIGRWIQFRQQHRAAKSIELLLRLTPRHANRVTNDQTEAVLVDRLKVGDVVRVAAGDSIPVDGPVVFGQTLVDQSLLTGESLPVAVSAGDSVCAGTVNLRQLIDVEVFATGRESRIGRVMETVDQASAEKAAIVHLGDRIGGVFVIVVTLLAFISFWKWMPHGLTVAASHATALLIVACPCALALATPLAIAVSLGRAAKRRIMIRDGSTFQRLSNPGTIWFDKTGTLTQGRVHVEFVRGNFSAVELAAAIEKECCHPIADGIMRLADCEFPNWAQDMKPANSEIGLGGVSGMVGDNRVHVGNFSFMETNGVRVDSPFRYSADQCIRNGASPILVAVDLEVVALLQASDPIKADARTTVAQLKASGWKVGLLSGDHAGIASAVAESVGIEAENALGGLSPEDKVQIVRDNLPGQPVVMVGDGANDAAALASADVGIAVHGSAEVSLQAAPVFVSSGQLHSITDLIDGSRRVMGLIKTAFAVSLAYNLLAVGLAMAGKISPLLAAILMPISSVSVLSLVLAWPTIEERQP